MTDREKVIKGLECAIGVRGRKKCDDCPYDNDFNCVGCDIVMRDAIVMLKEQEAVIDALLNVGYPHNFQREEPWIRDYCYKITEVVKMAYSVVEMQGGRDDYVE